MFYTYKRANFSLAKKQRVQELHIFSGDKNTSA